MVWVVGLGFGGIIGSFLNVCIYRLPRDQSVVKPRSRCTHCRLQIAWYDNIPLASFAALGGRCRHCRKPISWRYPAVEAVTALVITAVLLRFGLGAVGWIYAVFVAGLIASRVIDLGVQIIPDEISLRGGGGGGGGGGLDLRGLRGGADRLQRHRSGVPDHPG